MGVIIQFFECGLDVVVLEVQKVVEVGCVERGIGGGLFDGGWHRAAFGVGEDLKIADTNPPGRGFGRVERFDDVEVRRKVRSG